MFSPAEFSTEWFSWKSPWLIAEVAELTRKIPTGQPTNFLMPVSSEDRLGFIMVSHKTGTKLTFALTKIDYDASGEDILGYNFECIDHPHTTLKALIIND